MLDSTIIGAIDIGSNAIRLQVTSIEHYEKEDVRKRISWLRIPLRLGDDVFTVGKLSEAKIAKLLDVMLAFKYVMKSFGVERYMACATSAMREAENGAQVVERILKETGVDIDIIDGKYEADIIFKGGLDEIVSRSNDNYLFVDVGGGSTELTVFMAGNKVASQSFKLGTVRILSSGNLQEHWDQMKAWIRSIRDQGYNPNVIVGSGGNINKIARMLDKKGTAPLNYTEMKLLYEHLNSFTLEERIHQLRLNVHRADVILPALKIFLTVMKTSKADQVITPKVGMIEGITAILAEQIKEQRESQNSLNKGIEGR